MRSLPEPWCRGLVCGVFALALAPTAFFTLAPAADLPSHVAISSVLHRLLIGDPEVSRHYLLNIQPVPYYLAYALLTPLVAWLGPWWGAKLFLLIIGGSTLSGCAALLRSLGAPWWATLVAVFVFYSETFFWGFVPTQAALPCLVWGAWALWRRVQTGRSRFTVGAAVAGLCACLAHVVMLLPWGVYVGAFASLAPRRHARAAAVIGAVSCLPLLGWLSQLARLSHSGAATPALRFDGFTGLVHHLKMHLALFDRGLGRTSHVAFLLLIVGVAWGSRRSGAVSPEFVFCRRALAGLMALFALVPLQAAVGGALAWGINFRYLALVELHLVAWATCAWCSPGRWATGRRSPARDATIRFATQPRMTVALAAVVLLHLGALVHAWSAFEHTAAPLMRVLAHAPKGATWASVHEASPYRRFWPPVTAHLHCYDVALGGAYEATLFAGAHIPIAAPKPLGPNDVDLVLVESPAAPPTALQGATPLAREGLWSVYSNATRRLPPVSCTTAIIDRL